jgi:CBS domain containing-hemolysin-like protein
LFEPEGCVKIADSTVAVSAAVSEINDNVTTAVAVSPAVIVSVAESIVSVGAITAALVGSAEITPKVIAAARPRAIFLNEFIFLLVFIIN